MRSFLSLDLTPDLRSTLVTLQKRLLPFDVKLVEPENLHFTIKFLGDIDETTARDVSNQLTILLERYPSFDTDIRGVGVFPHLSAPRVVWVGSPGLCYLYAAVETAVSDHFSPNLAVIPHVTLARARSSRDHAALREFIETHRESVFGSMTVREVKLMKSIITPQGPVYEDISVFPLMLSHGH